jgi:hypothetical protein
MGGRFVYEVQEDKGDAGSMERGRCELHFLPRKDVDAKKTVCVKGSNVIGINAETCVLSSSRGRVSYRTEGLRYEQDDRVYVYLSRAKV